MFLINLLVEATGLENMPMYSSQYVENLQNIIDLQRYNLNTLLWVFGAIVAILGLLNVTNLFMSFNIMFKTKKEVNDLNKKSIFLIDFLDFTTREEYLHNEYKIVLVNKMLDLMITRKDLFKDELFTKIEFLITVLTIKFDPHCSNDNKNWNFVGSHFIFRKIERINNIYCDSSISDAFDRYKKEIDKYKELKHIKPLQ